MTQSYVQYLNIGLGLINNTEPISEWNIDNAIESSLMLDDSALDINIIGFRFYDIETTNNNVIRRSGIYYLQGEVFTYPKIDQELTDFFKNTTVDFSNGQQLIKIKKPYLLVYKYNEDDTIVNAESVLSKIQAKKDEEQLAALKADIMRYKTNLLQELRNVCDAIDNSNYHTISLAASPSTNSKSLNLLNDNGDFSKHIEYLRNTRLQILNLEKKLNS